MYYYQEKIYYIPTSTFFPKIGNILYTYIDYYYNKFNEKPDIKLIKKVAKVISWNIWQMDGIKYVIPNSEVHSRIMNWDTNRKVKFENLLKNK